MNVIIDTDLGVDDALALMLAIKSGKFNIKAITTVAGNTTIENATRNTKYILGLLNSKIPVYSGEAKPLQRELIKAKVHGEQGLGEIKLTGQTELTNNALQKITELSDEETTIITLGPLTNIAKAIPKLTAKQIIIMGGALKAPGNKNGAEFNIYVDPEAADIVFKAPIKKTLMPLDVCNKVALSMKDFEQITGILKEPILKMVKLYTEKLQEEGYKGAIMYDPLTIYYLLKPEAFKTAVHKIAADKTGKTTITQTGTEITTAEDIDAEEFKKDFLKTINQIQAHHLQP
ncbi:nucleoside hydrolase [Candidatus Woesearchaeota archaeon]|nr:nucleoside hydrolase [Candidatus Woesearchaeota archaeon]MBW3016478.1 nucleoside hydrolase [Candidatus Woesearchaeota archaeon]